MHLMVFFVTIIFGRIICDEGQESRKSIHYETPILNEEKFHFFETFDNTDVFSKVWIKSQAKKDGIEEALSKYDGVWEVETAAKESLSGDLGLVLKSKAKHAAIASTLKKPFMFSDQPFIIQYEVQFQDGQECGGAYLKLLSQDKLTVDLTKFHDKTPYSIMFGPDKCGNDYKLHFIFRHKNPKNGSISEKHSKKPSERLEDFFNDKKPHLYTLILNPDNSYKVLVDHQVVNQGTLLDDFTPPVNPPSEIDDPADKKPADWDDREKIPDITASKPDDWDESAPQTIEDPDANKPDGWLDNEPLHIRDPFAEKPDDWDEEMDGEWEAPLVSNPACEDSSGCGVWLPPMIANPNFKGKWHPPIIDNPNYQGQWKPKRIPNPDFFEDKLPFRMSSIIAVGFELWSMSPNILFDNVIITDRIEVADELASKTFDLKKRLIEMDADTFVSRIVNYTNAHPWLWAVYVIVLLVPITIIAVFCFGSSSKEKNQLSADALHKRTDEIVADDEPVGESSGNINLAEDTASNSPTNATHESNDLENEETMEETDAENVELLASDEHSEDREIASQDNADGHEEFNNIEDTNESNFDTEDENDGNEVVHSTQDSSTRKRCQRID